MLFICACLCYHCKISTSNITEKLSNMTLHPPLCFSLLFIILSLPQITPSSFLLRPQVAMPLSPFLNMVSRKKPSLNIPYPLWLTCRVLITPWSPLPDVNVTLRNPFVALLLSLTLCFPLIKIVWHLQSMILQAVILMSSWDWSFIPPLCT